MAIIFSYACVYCLYTGYGGEDCNVESSFYFMPLKKLNILLFIKLFYAFVDTINRDK